MFEDGELAMGVWRTAYASAQEWVAEVEHSNWEQPQPTGMLGITFWQDQNPRNSLCISELRATRRPCPVTH
jgi:hypothetical protein